MVMLPPIEVDLIGYNRAAVQAVLEHILGLKPQGVTHADIVKPDEDDHQLDPRGTLICVLYREDAHVGQLRTLIAKVCEEYRAFTPPPACETCHQPLYQGQS